MRNGLRHTTRRLFSSSSTGKVLGEEEKAAENVYIKKMEQTKLENLARKGPQPADQNGTVVTPPGTSEPHVGSTSSSGGSQSSTAKVSTDKYKNYAVVAGVVTFFGALGWYLKGSEKKVETRD